MVILKPQISQIAQIFSLAFSVQLCVSSVKLCVPVSHSLLVLRKERQTFGAKVLPANGVQAGVGAPVGDFLAAPGHVRLTAVLHDVPGILGKQNDGVGF
jgi:hypothetical protein